MMLAKFDPVRARQGWLDFSLKVETDFNPDLMPAHGHSHYVAFMTNSLIEAYWVGLADHVRPTLEKIIAWMEVQPEPEMRLFSDKWRHWRDGWYALYTWRRTLGLCKWLSRGDNGQRHFAAALDVEWQSWQEASADQAAQDKKERQEGLSECLAMALAANTPGLGLKLYDTANVKRPSNDQAPLLQFGRWACEHLARGGGRDETFIAQGADMLRASLLPNFFWGGNRTEPALWLKAIYWDSGVAQTPEQAIARAYDSMPGVERPDFVPR
jgi:hypothetical protein